MATDVEDVHDVPGGRVALNLHGLGDRRTGSRRHLRATRFVSVSVQRCRCPAGLTRWSTAAGTDGAVRAGAAHGRPHGRRDRSISVAHRARELRLPIAVVIELVITWKCLRGGLTLRGRMAKRDATCTRRRG